MIHQVRAAIVAGKPQPEWFQQNQFEPQFSNSDYIESASPVVYDSPYSAPVEYH